MKRFILFTLLTLFILTTVMGPFTIHPTDLRLESVETVLAQSGAGDASVNARKPGEGSDSSGCGPFSPLKCIVRGAAIVSEEVVLKFFGWVLGVAGSILDLVMQETVIEMGDNLKEVGAITDGFKVFRDLANIVLIFAFLAIGIGTILQLQNYSIGKLLPMLIIVALLVNFSLFFTRAIIDGGNLLATRFYEKIQQDCPAEAKAENNCKVSDQFMQITSLLTLYDYDPKTGVATTGIAAAEPNKLSDGNIITIALMGSLLFLVTTFVFLSAALLLVTRFVVLIFLMVLAPLAFVAMAIPYFKGHATKWWGTLINYTIFAPAYFILVWFVLQVVSSFKTSFFTGQNVPKEFASTVSDTTGQIGIENFAIFLNFIIATGFMIAALFIAKHLGIAGSNAVMNAGNNLRKFGQRKAGDTVLGGSAALGRRFFGRRAMNYSERKGDDLQRTASQGGIRGAWARTRLGFADKLSKSSFDARGAPGGKQASAALGLGTAGGKGGYEAIRKKQVERRVAAGERVGKVHENERETQKKEFLHQELTYARDRLAAAKPEQRTQAQSAVKTVEDKLKNLQVKINRQGAIRKEGLARVYMKPTIISRIFRQTPARRAAAAKLRTAKTTAVKITEALKQDKDLTNSLTSKAPPEKPPETPPSTN